MSRREKICPSWICQDEGPNYGFFGPPNFSPIEEPERFISQVKRAGKAYKLHTTKFDTERSLELAQDLGIWDGPTRLIVLDHGRLLVDLLGEIFLRKLLLHTCSLDSLGKRSSSFSKGIIMGKTQVHVPFLLMAQLLMAVQPRFHGQALLFFGGRFLRDRNNRIYISETGWGRREYNETHRHALCCCHLSPSYQWLRQLLLAVPIEFGQHFHS